MSLPDNFDIANLENHILSIRVGQNSLSFTIYEPGVGKSFIYQEFNFSKDCDLLTEVQHIILDHNYLTHVYKHVNVMYMSQDFDLVPEYLFEKKYTKSLFEMTHFEPKGEVLTSEILVQNNYLLFCVDAEVHRFLVRSLRTPSFFHYASVLLPYFWAKAKVIDSAAQMYLYFHEKTIDIFCFQNLKILHSLSYSESCTSDIIYYVLNVWEKSRYSQTEDHLFIGGESAKISEITIGLNKYIKNISALSMPSDIQFLNPVAAKVPLDLIIFSL